MGSAHFLEIRDPDFSFAIGIIAVRNFFTKKIILCHNHVSAQKKYSGVMAEPLEAECFL